MKERLASLFAAVSRFSPANKARIALAVLAALLLGYLLFAQKPWTVTAEPGKSFRVPQYVAIWFWIAALINLALVAALAATAGWWTRPAAQIENQKSKIENPRWFWPLVVIAMLLTAVWSWPRLGLSLWHDEANRVRNTISGQFREQEDGSWKFRAVNWQSAFFDYRLPNHILQNVLSKASNDIWRFFARPTGLRFNETAVRFPSYLAGIASVAAIALLLRQAGLASAGVIAAFLFALHPWHIRYSSEARGYALALALVSLLLFFFLKALESGRWRWWAACAAAQFALIYAYATSVYVVLVFSLCAPLAILARYGWSGKAFTLGLRWFVSSLFAAMALLQMMLPCVPQFLAYVKKTGGMGSLDYQWLQEFFCHLLCGTAWSYTDQHASDYVEIYPWFLRHPGLGVLILLLAISCFALGTRRLLVRNSVSWILPVVLILPAALCFAVTKAGSGYLHEWYLIFALPGAVALAATGLDELIAAAQSRPARMAAVAAVALVLSGYAAWTAPQRNVLLTQSIQTDRESVLLTRPVLDPNDARQKAILTATFFAPPGPYDPRIIRFQNLNDLKELARRADREGKDLYINLGFLDTVRAEHPHKYEVLKNSELFEEVGFLQGLTPPLSRHVFKYRPGSADEFDFENQPADPGSPSDRSPE